MKYRFSVFGFLILVEEKMDLTRTYVTICKIGKVGKWKTINPMIEAGTLEYWNIGMMGNSIQEILVNYFVC